MRAQSLNARIHHAAAHSAEVEIVLVRISHPDLVGPIRLSTDPTERLSLEPLAYGTRSAWLADPVTEPHLFVLISALLPDDREDAPPAGQLRLENVDAGIGQLLLSTPRRATVDLAVVVASSPDDPEAEWRGLELVSAELTAGDITLSMSAEAIHAEPFPAGRMTKDRFPGLFR